MGKRVILPTHFLNRFKGFIGVNTSFGQIRQSIFMLRSWEKIEEKKKREKDQDFAKNANRF